MDEDKIEKLVEEDYDKYIELRDDYFNKYKSEIVNDWFVLKEKTIEEYFERASIDLKKLVASRKRFSF